MTRFQRAISASVFIVLLITVGVLIYTRMRVKVFDVAHAGTNIVAFGDSLTEGVGSTPGNDFVSELSRRIGKPIINSGRSGDTTTTALGRVQNDVLARDPRVVIVLFGGNDALQGVPVETTFSNLGKIIDHIHDVGAAVILVGIQSGAIGDQYKDKFAVLAKEKIVNFVPNILDGVIGHSDLMSDAVHPNDRGYEIIAKSLEPVLSKVLAKSK